MPAAIPIIGAVAGYAAAEAISTIPLGILAGSLATGLAGIGITSSIVGAAAGFVVATAINAIGSRAFSPSNSTSSYSTANAHSWESCMDLRAVPRRSTSWGMVPAPLPSAARAVMDRPCTR